MTNKLETWAYHLSTVHKGWTLAAYKSKHGSVPAKVVSYQVWPLTQFFSVSFLRKLIDLPGGQINDPSSGKHYSLPFLPATPSSPSRTLEGLFELTRRPSRALDSPRALLPELQRYKDTVRCAALGAEVPGHRQQQLTETLIVRLLKTHFLTPILDFEKSTEHHGLRTRNRPINKHSTKNLGATGRHLVHMGLERMIF